MQTKILLFLGVLWLFSPSVAAKKKKSKLNRLALAALLVKDGYLRRAEIVLSKVNRNDKKLNKVRFFTLRGVVFFRLKKSQKAIVSFEKSLKAGQKDTMVYLFLAQAYFQLKKYQKALGALLKAPAKAEEKAGTFLLKAQCYWKLKQKTQAYIALVSGRKKHPQSLQIHRLQILLLMELRLYREAMKVGREYVKKVTDSTEPFLMLGDALRKGRQYKEAARFLEEARLRFQDDQKVLLLLARVYLEGGHLFSAAVILERAALRVPRLLVEAAELYRRSRRLWRAFHVNARVLNQKAKFRQRLGLLIQLQRFEEAAALEPRLSRLGLLRQQKLRYALAFAYFKTSRMKDTLRLLRGITERGLFQKAIALRKAIQTCRQRKEGCN